MPCTNLFRLSPGLVSGTWSHNPTTNIATISLTFDAVSPITLSITGDVPAFLAGRNAAIYGYTEVPADEASSLGVPATKVATYAAALAANATGIMPRYELDDDGGVSVTWCSSVTRQPIGNAKFMINQRRTL